MRFPFTINFSFSGGVFARSLGSPFGYHQGEGVDAGKYDTDWIVNTRRQKYDEIYKNMGPINGKVMESGILASKVYNILPYLSWRCFCK